MFDFEVHEIYLNKYINSLTDFDPCSHMVKIYVNQIVLVTNQTTKFWLVVCFILLSVARNFMLNLTDTKTQMNRQISNRNTNKFVNLPTDTIWGRALVGYFIQSLSSSETRIPIPCPVECLLWSRRYCAFKLWRSKSCIRYIFIRKLWYLMVILSYKNVADSR